MSKALRDLVAISGVQTVMIVSGEGQLVEAHGDTSALSDPGRRILEGLAGILEGHTGAEVVFSRGRLYARRTEGACLVVLAKGETPMALVRLQADLVLTESRPKARRGFLGLLGAR